MHRIRMFGHRTDLRTTFILFVVELITTEQCTDKLPISYNMKHWGHPVCRIAAWNCVLETIWFEQSTLHLPGSAAEKRTKNNP